MQQQRDLRRDLIYTTCDVASDVAAAVYITSHVAMIYNMPRRIRYVSSHVASHVAAASVIQYMTSDIAVIYDKSNGTSNILHVI